MSNAAANVGTVPNEHHALRSAAEFTSGMAVGDRILAGILAVATVVVVVVVVAGCETPARVAAAEPVQAGTTA